MSVIWERKVQRGEGAFEDPELNYVVIAIAALPWFASWIFWVGYLRLAGPR